MKIVLNGKEKEFDRESMTVFDLANLLDLEGKRYAIERNGEIISRSDFSIVYIKNGDQLEIVGAVGGG